MTQSLDDLVSKGLDFIRSEFNIKPEKSQLKLYSSENWQEFCKTNNFDVNSEGLYIPRSYSAYVNGNSKVLISNIFHEFFGHGLFCEHSQIGKQLIEIIQGNRNTKEFLYNAINIVKQPLGLIRKNIDNYEGFAVWLEALICEETDNKKIWEIKKNRMPKDYISLFEFFKYSEQKLTRFGLMSQLGFPKFYDSKKLVEILKHLYNSSFMNINFIVLYGSQKPERDIDLFIVSNNSSQNYFNGWLDIYELNLGEFKKLVENLDISVTDPLFSGKLIYGNKNYFKQVKQRILEESITQQAINHNLGRVEQQKTNLSQFENDLRKKKACLSYIGSYSKNAKELKKGKKLLTLNKLEFSDKTEDYLRKHLKN